MVPQEADRENYRKEAGVRLRQLRLARGLKQAQLAEKAGIQQSDISAFERGARGMTPFQRAAVATALGIDQTVLDPMVVKEFDLAATLSDAAPSSGPVSDPRSTLPSALEGFLAKHPELPDQVRWHLVENRQFRLAPWKKQDEQFWAEMAEFWTRYLRENPPASGAKGRSTPGKGGG